MKKLAVAAVHTAGLNSVYFSTHLVPPFD